MITTNTGAKKLEASDNWREIFPNPDLSTAGAHNASVDAADRIQPEIAPIINGKQCALGAASGDYVLLRNSTITGKSDGAYIATKAIPANTDIDSTYLGNAITGGISNSLNNNLTSQLINLTKPSVTGISVSNNTFAEKVGKIVMLAFEIDVTGSTLQYSTIITGLPAPDATIYQRVLSGTSDFANIAINTSGDALIYPSSNGTFIGVLTYISH